MTRIILILFFFYAWLPSVDGQSGFSFDLKKPQKYENKKLGSEKTQDKKWTLPRRFTQNGVTKFNYHFNARNKLMQVLERAKAAHQDDYTQLLSFYNYSLENTAREKQELDSVIYKANTGILIHDLRNSWVDNLYMLMGQAYYLRNELDSAFLTFQYINYAFSPKEKDGYDKPIGSNANEGGNAFTISTKEKTGLMHKVWTSPPSRNESFIWQIRTFLAKGETPEAAGLIETLKQDPQFPERLRSELREMQALYFYKQELYDSAAFYLEQALDNAADREERARWEYLVGQLYDRAGKHEQAEEFFNRTVKHTLNPVLEIYARLYAIRQNKGDDHIIQQNIDDLVRMAKRDRYTNYRDIIYYMAAQMELERNNVAGARAFLLKATQSMVEGTHHISRSQAFLQLAELSFREKDYRESKRFYDSLNIAELEGQDIDKLEDRKAVLAVIVQQLDIISRQDSLQKIAAMPEAEREAYIRKLVKQLRKQQGLKDEDAGANGGNFAGNDNKDQPTDLFGNNAKGEWYFHNNALKSRGFNEFKNRWGNRPNADNWRREAAAAAAANLQKNLRNMPGLPMRGEQQTNVAESLTYEGLLQHVPLTAEQVAASNDSLGDATFTLGKTYLEGLEDYGEAITSLEKFVQHYSANDNLPHALFLLHYCYIKTGNTQRASEIAAQIKQRYPNSEYDRIASNPGTISSDSAAKLDMTRRYDDIYTKFIEGRFPEALAAKKEADSLYHQNYWTPQLLYIQSVYHIRNRQDVEARKVLNDIITTFPGTPMAEKAKTMADVLARRKEIEEYLTRLQIERPAEDSVPGIVYTPPVVRTEVVTRDPQKQPPVVDSTQAGQPDTTATIDPAVVAKAPAADSTATTNPQVVAHKPPADTLATVPALAQKPDVQPQTDSAASIRPTAVTKAPAADTLAKSGPEVVAHKPPADSIANINRPVTPPPVQTDQAQDAAKRTFKGFTVDTAAAHMAVLVLDKVDAVYVTEARNAFNRYNKETFYNRTIGVGHFNLTDDLRFVLMDGFENAGAALAYTERARKDAPREVIPWLPANKYSFIIISKQNLDVLNNSKDMSAYMQFLAQLFPGKF